MFHIEHKIVDAVNDLHNCDWSVMDLAKGADFNTILSSGFDEYFFRNILKKAQNLNLDDDPTAAALADFLSFLEAQEEKQFSVSLLLKNSSQSPVFHRILGNARDSFSKIFADFHPALIKPRFTLGSTITLPKGSSIFARVKASEGHKTLVAAFDSLYPSFGSALYETYPHTEGTDHNHVKISVVPKTAKIGRVIGSPPSSMLAFQCGLGDYFESKLRQHCNIDLSTAQEKHKSLAMEHSLDGPFCTLDQRKASDNILRCLVFNLVPKEVAAYMDAISPRHLLIGDTMHYTHMLCAAGNGFNTAFQTLLFWVLIKAIQKEVNIRQPVYVYGDDVIAHSDVYDSICKVFPLLGLEINQDKSFKAGPFRESCGGDFLYGNNIRPFYAKNVPTNTIDLIRFVNGIRRVGYYNNANVWRSNSIRRFWFRILLLIPKDARLFCPKHYGDAGINTEHTILYQFADPIRWDRERTTKYPGEGCDESGQPYGAERIRIYVSATAGDKSTFASESKGLSARNVLSLLTHASVANSGTRLRKVTKIGQSPDFYPAVYGGSFDSYKRTFVPYTLTGQAPINIDDLFDLISKGSGQKITNTDYVLDRYSLKRLSLISELMGILNLHALKRKDREREALQTFMGLVL